MVLLTCLYRYSELVVKKKVLVPVFESEPEVN